MILFLTIQIASQIMKMYFLNNNKKIKLATVRAVQQPDSLDRGHLRA